MSRVPVRMSDMRPDGTWSDVPYPAMLSTRLRPAETRTPLVLDLFAGCGGLALGFEAAGFETHGFEMEPDYAATYRSNLKGECSETFLTPDSDLPDASIVIGGPPCQPFSVGGSQRGRKDDRDGFPAFIAAVRRLKPDLALVENVRGMLYRNRRYLKRILAELRTMDYDVDVELLNAKHFGVPQNRERVIIAGSSRRLGMAGPRVWSAPDGWGSCRRHSPQHPRGRTVPHGRHGSIHSRL
jgi:DNA (cytosine-5)-methyltransferase 1